MKNKKQPTSNIIQSPGTAKVKTGYAALDFEQGRGGSQSGHAAIETENFPQFPNAGNAGYAAQETANSVAASKEKTKK